MTDNNLSPFLFALDHIVVSLAGKPVIKNLSLKMQKGEALAMTGGSGSGKTVLAHTIAGRYFFQGNYSVPGGTAEAFQRGVQVVEQQHRFRNRNQTADQYYQQRFNSLNATETVTVEEELMPFGEGVGAFSKKRLLDLFGIEKLTAEPLIQLSNGENKRLQMVKALLTPHRLVILDQPFTGLDAAGRMALSSVLDALHEAGETILLITTKRDIPSRFSRHLLLDEGRIAGDGPVDRNEMPVPVQQAPEKNRFVTLPLPGDRLIDFPLFEYAFQFRHVSIRYEEKLVLDDLSWSVKRGECWSLSGPNGAGKSTLLSLVTGDNPQAYANDIELFDRPRGSGESIWHIKQKTGLVSPELHLFFDPAATLYATLASGLFDTIGLFRALTHGQDALVKAWLEFLGLENEMNGLLNRLPAGKQRIALLGRALIKHPPLLILDEPCQGLDEPAIEAVKQLVDRYCRARETTLIYVSHYSEEWPSCVTHSASLNQGRISLRY